MRDYLKEHVIFNKSEFKRINNEIKVLKKENIDLLQKIGTAQAKLADLELFIGFEKHHLYNNK